MNLPTFLTPAGQKILSVPYQLTIFNAMEKGVVSGKNMAQTFASTRTTNRSMASSLLALKKVVQISIISVLLSARSWLGKITSIAFCNDQTLCKVTVDSAHWIDALTKSFNTHLALANSLRPTEF